MKTIPLFDVQAQNQQCQPLLAAAFDAMVKDCRFILGPSVANFERAVAEHVGAKHAVGVACGTDALVLSLKALGVEGREVITTAFSFVATASAIVRAGATPVFVDIDPDTYNIDHRKIASAINERTAAILPVLLFGRPAPSEHIRDIALHHELAVIEDAAQAFGAMPVGYHAGVGSDPVSSAVCFSFFPTKPLGGLGDGGMVVTDSESLAVEVSQLRAQGCVNKYSAERVGFNSRLDALQAAMLTHKLRFVPEWQANRARLAGRYYESKEIKTRAPWWDGGSAWSIFPIKTKDSAERAQLCSALSEAGVSTAVHYPTPLHRQPAFEKYATVACPVADDMARRLVSIPLYAEMTEQQQEHVIGVIERFYGSLA